MATKGKKPMTTYGLTEDRTVTTQIVTAKEVASYLPHPTVQRGLDVTYARKLQKALLDSDSLGFAPIGCFLTIVQDGQHYVFDGQHRLFAIKQVLLEQETEELEHQTSIDTYNEGMADLMRMQQEQPDVDIAAIKRSRGLLDEPSAYVPDPDYTRLLNSPVVVVRYEGNWTDTQLRELFASYNSGKKVNTNLLTAFTSENEELVNELANRGWLGRLIEDKAGKNSNALFGVTDVVRWVGKLGMHTTLMLLDKVFAQYDAYDATERGKLEPIGLYNGVSKSLGTSVRFLNAAARVIGYAMTDDSEALLNVIAAAARKLMASPTDCARYVPGVYATSKTGFVLTSATVVENTISNWLIWVVSQALPLTIVLPKVYAKKLDTIEAVFEQVYDLNDVATPAADVVETFSTLVIKTPVKAKVRSSGYRAMKTPNVDAEQLELPTLDLDPNTIDL